MAITSHVLCVDEVNEKKDSQEFSITFSPTNQPAPLTEVTKIDQNKSVINIRDISSNSTSILYNYDANIWYSYKPSANQPEQTSVLTKSGDKVYNFPNGTNPCRENLNPKVIPQFTATHTINSITINVTASLQYNIENCILLEVQGELK